MGPSATICRISRSKVPCGRSGLFVSIPPPPTRADYTPAHVEAQGVAAEVGFGLWALEVGFGKGCGSLDRVLESGCAILSGCKPSGDQPPAPSLRAQPP